MAVIASGHRASCVTVSTAVVPEYGPRAAHPSKLGAYKPYLEERLRAGVWNARVLLRGLRERNFTGSYTILTDWLRPQQDLTLALRICLLWSGTTTLVQALPLVR